MMNFNNSYGQPYYGMSTPQPQMAQYFKIIPIANRNDMNSAVADFNGTPIYFHDQSNNQIYIKQFDIKTGLTTTQEFKKVEQGNNNQPNPLDVINAKIDGLQRIFEDYVKSQNKPVVEEKVEIEVETKKGGRKS